jgi:hypothetical protein
MDPTIREKILIIQKKVQELRENSVTVPFDLEMYFIDNMPELYDAYPTIIKRFCREENPDNAYLYKMINLLEQVNDNKKTFKDVETNLAKELADKFVYPVVKKEEEKNKKNLK